MNIDPMRQKRELFLKDPFWERPAGGSILPRMLVLLFLPMPLGVNHDDDKNHEAYREKNKYAGLTFPNLLYATRKLGPIHVEAQYTPKGQK